VIGKRSVDMFLLCYRHEDICRVPRCYGLRLDANSVKQEMMRQMAPVPPPDCRRIVFSGVLHCCMVMTLYIIVTRVTCRQRWRMASAKSVPIFQQKAQPYSPGPVPMKMPQEARKRPEVSRTLDDASPATVRRVGSNVVASSVLRRGTDMSKRTKSALS